MKIVKRVLSVESIIMPYYKTPAIVIKSIDYKEADKIITFFTKNFGKIAVISRGVRKSKRGKSASVDLFTYSDIVIYEKEKNKLCTLSQVEIVESFYSLLQDFNKISCLLFIIQFLDQLLVENIPSILLFELTINTLNLVKKNNKSLKNFIYAFVLKALKYLGYTLNLNNCVKCNAKVSKSTVSFSIKLGGILCDNCQEKESFMVSKGTIEALAYFQKAKLEKAQCLVLFKSIEENYKKSIFPFIEFHTEVKLKSLEEIQKQISECNIFNL